MSETIQGTVEGLGIYGCFSHIHADTKHLEILLLTNSNLVRSKLGAEILHF